jgi:hypothetical protein
VNVPARWLTGEHIPHVSADLKKRSSFLVIGLLELANHFDVPPVVRCMRRLSVISPDEEVELSLSFGTDKLLWFCCRIVPASFL